MNYLPFLLNLRDLGCLVNNLKNQASGKQDCLNLFYKQLTELFNGYRNAAFLKCKNLTFLIPSHTLSSKKINQRKAEAKGIYRDSICNRMVKRPHIYQASSSFGFNPQNSSNLETAPS